MLNNVGLKQELWHVLDHDHQEREYGGADTLPMPTAFRHVSLGHGNPAQGRGGSTILPPMDRAVAGRRKDVHLQELLLPMAAIKTRMAAIKTRAQLAVESKNI